MSALFELLHSHHPISGFLGFPINVLHSLEKQNKVAPKLSFVLGYQLRC